MFQNTNQIKMLGFLKGMLAAMVAIALFGYAGYTLNLLLDAFRNGFHNGSVIFVHETRICTNKIWIVKYRARLFWKMSSERS